MRTQRGADLALVLLSLVWGGSFVLVKKILAGISPFYFLTLRFGSASLLLYWVRPAGSRVLSRSNWKEGGLIGAALAMGFVFQTAGLLYTTPAKSAFVTGLSIIFVPLIGILFLRLVPSGPVLGGIGLAALGLLLLTYPAGGADWNPGDLLTLGCAVAFSLHILLLERFARPDNCFQLARVQIYVCALLSPLLLGLLETPRMDASPALGIAILVMGLVATAGAFLLQTAAQSRTSSARVALILSLEPVFATLFSYLFHDENLSARELLGGAAIIAGVLVAELIGSRQERRTPPPAPGSTGSGTDVRL